MLKSEWLRADERASDRSSGLPMAGRALLSRNFSKHTHSIRHERNNLLTSRSLVGTPQARKAQYDPQFIRSIPLGKTPPLPPMAVDVAGDTPRVGIESEPEQLRPSS